MQNSRSYTNVSSVELRYSFKKVVPALGNAMMLKSSIQLMSPMTVPFSVMSSSRGGSSTTLVSSLLISNCCFVVAGTTADGNGRRKPAVIQCGWDASMRPDIISSRM